MGSQSSGHAAARQRITFRLGSLLLVIALALFLFVCIFASNFSLSTDIASRSSSVEKNGVWGQHLVVTNAGDGEISAIDTNLDESTGFDNSMTVAGCAENRGQRSDCLMDGRLYSYSEGGPWAAQMKQAQAKPTQAHGSNLLILPSGEVLCTWFSGVESEDEVAIVLARLPSGSVQWSDPIVVSVTMGRSAQNPVLFYDVEDALLVLYHTSQVAFRGQGTAHVVELRSSDRGQTWNTPRIVFNEQGAFLRNHIVLLPGDRWLMPMYYTPDGYGHFETHYSACKLSVDHGKTWKEYPMTSKGQFLVQPTVVQGRKGLIAYFRNRHADWVFTSVSTNEGRSWSAPVKTVIPNNNSGLQALFLKSGSLILVFNNRSGAKRHPLSIALSEDEGLTWKYVRDVEPGDPSELPPDGEYSYPSVVQSADGFIHVTYTYLRQTIKYVRLKESWIREGSKGGTVGEYTV